MVEGEQGLLLRRTWGAGKREQRRSRRRNVECCYILLHFCSLLKLQRTTAFLTAQLITSLWLLIFRQFKASSLE